MDQDEKVTWNAGVPQKMRAYDAISHTLHHTKILASTGPHRLTV